MKTLARGAVLVLLAGSLSCAAANLQPLPRSEPAARAGLRPEFRLFYDALQEYGEWTPIEPYGYVFRPSVSYIGWEPYEFGYWAPTDLYGWVWVSSEPWGWATYHYGRWMFDRFEGWVWLPGIDWGPAWVTWNLADDYVGWAPMLAHTQAADLKADPWHYVSIDALGSTDLRSKTVTRTQLGARVHDIERIENVTDLNGVKINRGPALELIERKRGPLVRAEVREVNPVGEWRPSAKEPKTPPGVLEATRRAAEDAAHQAQRDVDAKAFAPSELRIIRPPAFKPAPKTPAPAAAKGAAADSTH